MRCLTPRTRCKEIVDDVVRDGMRRVVVDEHDCNSSRKAIGIESSIRRETVGVIASWWNQTV